MMQDTSRDKPEKQLNCFVRAVALIERVGNALGTLAFTWATVVLLGGYPTVLGRYDDFSYATTIVFLEAVRMFMSRNNRLDYQLFFRTKGAIRPLGWNGLIITIYLCSILRYFWRTTFARGPRPLSALMGILLLFIPAVLGLFNSSGALNLLPRQIRHAISVCSPLVATILPVPFLDTLNHYGDPNKRDMWTVLLVLLFLVVLLLTISRLRIQRVINLVEHALGNNTTKQVFWRRLILNISMFVELVMLMLMHDSPRLQGFLFGYSLYSLVIVLSGNLQIPAAIVRVVLSLLRLLTRDYNGADDGDDDAKTNLAPSLTVFYVMVLGQGVLYIGACLLEMFSFIPRSTLARRGGLTGQWGVQTVNLYYAYALENCMKKDILAPKQISLSSFAMDSINSDSPEKQLLGIQMMHNLTQSELARTQLLSKFDASTEMMSRIVGMLGWKRPEHKVIRFFAAKVIAELARGLRVATVPRVMQNVSSLLDADRIVEREHTLVDTDDEGEEEKQDIQVMGVSYIQEERHVFAMDPDGNQNQRNRINPLWDTSSSLVSEVHATHQVGMDKHNSSLLRCLKWMSTLWSISQQETETPTHQDYLPALGMSILDNLCCDQENYVEIIRQADLIPKIIEFTSNKYYTNNIKEDERKTLMQSSLKLLKKLSKTHGEVGITLQHKITEHPLLLINLAEILDDRYSSQGIRKLVIGILRNLALDADISQEIGSIHVITGRLMDAFLKQAAPSSDGCLQKIAGQALAMLTMESADNCKAVIMEAVNVIGELASMICENNRKYLAVRLLVNLFHHMQPALSNMDLMKLCEILPKVLDTILDAETEGAELEVMIGLSSQMCKVIPEEFARELENGHRKEMFVKRLVDLLQANMKPSIHYPEIRRVIIEQAIYLMTCCSSYYANVLNKYFMMDALLMVERTPSRVERYRIFLGNTGIMEHKQSLSDLVAEAVELLCHR